MRAVEVLPVPRGPQNRKACDSRPSRTAPTKARTTCSWPTTSSGDCGRYLRYRATSSATAASTLPHGADTEVTAAGRQSGDRALAVDERTTRSLDRAGGSGQALPRHPPAPAYRCYLPVLTGFAGWRRAGPGLQRSVPGASGPCGPKASIGPARAGCGYRAPLAPHLARSPRPSIRGRPDAQAGPPPPPRRLTTIPAIREIPDTHRAAGPAATKAKLAFDRHRREVADEA